MNAAQKQMNASRLQLERGQKQISTLEFNLPWAEQTRTAQLGQSFDNAECPRLSSQEIGKLSKRAAKGAASEALLQSVILQESAGSPCAVSSKGALGLMQLMPDVASSLGVKDAFNPEENVRAGASHLAQLLGRYDGKVDLALAAYNAGPARVDAAGGIPNIVETQQYVKSILARLAARNSVMAPLAIQSETSESAELR